MGMGKQVATETEHQSLLRRYLLDSLPETDKERLEERLFKEHELFEELLIVEEELIDDYSQGRLALREREVFESKLLALPRTRRRVELARSFNQAIGEIAAESERWEPDRRKGRRGIKSRVVRWFPVRFQVSTIPLAAVAVLLLIGGSWITMQQLRLRSRMEGLERDRIRLLDREKELNQQMAAQEERVNHLTVALKAERAHGHVLEQEMLSRQQLTTIATFVLSPFRFRDSDTDQPLRLAKGKRFVRLKLQLDEIDYGAYQAVLTTDKGREIWSGRGRQKQGTSAGREVLVTVPATLFSTGEYLLSLYGTMPDGSKEEAASYSFRVDRK